MRGSRQRTSSAPDVVLVVVEVRGETDGAAADRSGHSLGVQPRHGGSSRSEGRHCDDRTAPSWSRISGVRPGSARHCRSRRSRHCTSPPAQTSWRLPLPKRYTLFLAAPIPFRGRFVRYVGRKLRPFPGTIIPPRPPRRREAVFPSSLASIAATEAVRTAETVCVCSVSPLGHHSSARPPPQADRGPR